DDPMAGVVVSRDHMAVRPANIAKRFLIYFWIELVHEEGAKDGDRFLVRHLVEEFLQAVRAARISIHVQDIHHLAPPAHVRKLAPGTRLGDGLPRKWLEDASIGI